MSVIPVPIPIQINGSIFLNPIMMVDNAPFQKMVDDICKSLDTDTESDSDYDSDDEFQFRKNPYYSRRFYSG
jgi:hypothetical protein